MKILALLGVLFSISGSAQQFQSIECTHPGGGQMLTVNVETMGNDYFMSWQMGSQGVPPRRASAYRQDRKLVFELENGNRLEVDTHFSSAVFTYYDYEQHLPVTAIMRCTIF